MNTQNLSAFGNRELEIASKLLYALAENNWNSEDDALGHEIRLEFNPHSGHVFLADEDGNVTMLNDRGKLENWLACGDCGGEGFKSEIGFTDDNLCKKCAKKR